MKDDAGRRCGRFEREGLSDLLDGDLGSSSSQTGSGRRAALAAHLEGCADCRADHAKYRRLAGAIARLGHGEQAPDPAERVLAIVERGLPPPERRLPRAALVVGLLAAIASVSALLWLLG
jgi:anti-sigma factor RsiW